MTSLRLALVLIGLSACTSSSPGARAKAPMAPAAPSATGPAPVAGSPEHVRMFEESLYQLSVIKPMLERGDRPGDLLVGASLGPDHEPVAMAEPALAFRFVIDGQLLRDVDPRQAVALVGIAAVDAWRSGPVALVVVAPPAGPPAGDRYTPVTLLLARATPPDGVERPVDGALAAYLQRAWGVTAPAPATPAVPLTALVLATALERHPVSGFWRPGSGSWVVLKVTSPGTGFVALDLEHGVGEIYPDVPADAGLGAALGSILR